MKNVFGLLFLFNDTERVRVDFHLKRYHIIRQEQEEAVIHYLWSIDLTSYQLLIKVMHVPTHQKPSIPCSSLCIDGEVTRRKVHQCWEVKHVMHCRTMIHGQSWRSFVKRGKDGFDLLHASGSNAHLDLPEGGHLSKTVTLVRKYQQ